MDTVLSTVHCFSQELQKSNIDYVAASGLIQACKTTFTKFRSDESWEEIVKQTDKLCDMIVGWRYQTTECLRKSFKVDMFFATLDKMLNEFDKRFTENIEVLRATSVFNPCLEKTFLNEKLIYILADHCQTAGIDKQILESEIKTAKALIDNQPQKANNIELLHDMLAATPNAFGELLSLIKIVLTIPVATASNERMFSTLSRVKNYLRSSCGDERLSDLLVLSCLTEDAKNINLLEVVTEFAKMKPRRYPDPLI
ncbi:hypothetical protein HELRODRAFT_182100 [Helobdella robusta]|uniref:HAT C-terminal dimerisation domain-containing protein n=1 Tax=Helobdella robusta TaxID=6412 RepID=T1FHR1_HELRO|nr:hypothetical protein HELRODRAFT_182100 [Helobdella robusta]ESN91244.1 hypothetical protein HELRODRAFT_182100 [Helobdella robusta]